MAFILPPLCFLYQSQVGRAVSLASIATRSDQHAAPSPLSMWDWLLFCLVEGGGQSVQWWHAGEGEGGGGSSGLVKNTVGFLNLGLNSFLYQRNELDSVPYNITCSSCVNYLLEAREEQYI